MGGRDGLMPLYRRVSPSRCWHWEISIGPEMVRNHHPYTPGTLDWATGGSGFPRACSSGWSVVSPAGVAPGDYYGLPGHRGGWVGKMFVSVWLAVCQHAVDRGATDAKG